MTYLPESEQSGDMLWSSPLRLRDSHRLGVRHFPRFGRHLAISWMALLGLLLMVTGRLAAAEPPEFTVIKVLVNGIRNSDDPTFPAIKPDVLNQLLENANAILKQAGIRLELEGAVDNTATDQGNDDGGIDKNEVEKLEKKSLEELKDKLKGKGVKINYAFGIDPTVVPNGESVAGFATHGVPVIYLRNIIDNLAWRANDLVHELCHVLTLPNHSTDTNNVLYPSNPISREGEPLAPRGTNLTPAQITEIKKKAAEIGQSSLNGQPLKNIRTLWIDGDDPTEFGFADFSFGEAQITRDGSEMVVSAILRELWPQTPIGEQFVIGLDTDDNGQTGESVGSMTGADYILTASLNGQYPFTQPFGGSQAILRNVSARTFQNLPPPIAIRENTIYETATQVELPIQDDRARLSFFIPMATLGNPRSLIRADILSIFQGPDPRDEAQFELSLESADGPRLSLSSLGGFPGDRIELKLQRFGPLSSLRIQFDDHLVLESQTGAQGELSLNLEVPNLTAAAYFVGARDGNGNFAFSEFSILPRPPRIQRVVIEGGALLIEAATGGFQHLTLEASENLETWSVVSTSDASGNTILFSLQVATLPKKSFFRIRGTH